MHWPYDFTYFILGTTTKKDTSVVWKTTTTTFMLSGTEVSSARQLKDKNEFLSLFSNTQWFRSDSAISEDGFCPCTFGWSIIFIRRTHKQFL